MSDDWIELCKRSIKRHEGYRPSPYRDTEGILTIGWGHNLDAKPLSPHVCNEIFNEDFDDAFMAARREMYFDGLPEAWRMVVIEMFFQLGSKFHSFDNLKVALIAGDWDRARTEMLDSLWARQTPQRVKDLIALTIGDVA